MAHQPPPPPNRPVQYQSYATSPPPPPSSSTMNPQTPQYGSSGAVASPPPPPPPPKADSFSPSTEQQLSHPGQAQFSHHPAGVDASSGLPPPPHPGSYSPVAQHSYGGPHQQQLQATQTQGPPPPSSDEQWLPNILKDKSKIDLETLVNDGSLLSALVHAPSTAHPSLASAQGPVRQQIAANVQLAGQVVALEGQIQKLRSSLTPSLLRVSALERQFRAKQEAMDDALAPWAPKAVHTRLGQGVLEQESWCRAMEESFLDGADPVPGQAGGGDGSGEAMGRSGSTGGMASDREVSEWLRRYREGRKVLELRKEKKLRLEEGRVGGWK